MGDAPVLFHGGVYDATWTGQLVEPTPTRQMKPDFHVVTASVPDPNFSIATPSKAITIQKEDARVSYIGPKSASLGGSATGIVPLSVMVKDITAVSGDAAWDPNAGDIRNAVVMFIDRSTNVVLGSASVTGSDPSTGVATLNWTVNLGTAKSKSYTIGFIVNYYYNRNNFADNATITISK
jgi:hypothetical protein